MILFKYSSLRCKKKKKVLCHLCKLLHNEGAMLNNFQDTIVNYLTIVKWDALPGREVILKGVLKHFQLKRTQSCKKI